ncbi:MAG TPA: DUF4142 domain-containing protein [Chthoniobacterales bacterium]
MKIPALVVCASLFAAAAISAAPAKESAGGSDAAFVAKAANGGMTEVELGKIAADKGQNQAVKDFGSRMVTDHSKANDQLKSIASKLGASVPDKADAKHQAVIDRFMKMQAGAAFDKAYASNMVKDHEEDVAEFQKASKQVKDADLKNFINDTLPVLKEHLAMAKKLGSSK